MPFPRQRLLRALPPALAVGLIALLTLEPRPLQAPLSASTPWHCLLCGGLGTVDVVLNLALFVPLGLALGRLGFTLKKGALIGFGLSCTVELLQATIVAGRDSSLSDLVTNTAGTLIGAALAGALPSLVSPSHRAARRLAAAAAAVWLLVLLFTAWAIRPAPAAGRTVLRSAPVLPNLDRFVGRVSTIVLNGTSEGPGPIESSRIREALAAGSIGLEAEATLRTWTDILAPIVDVADEEWNAVAQLGQLGQKVTFSVRSRSARLRLRTPSVKVYRALPPARGQTFLAGGRLENSVLSAYATADGTTHRAEVRLTPGLGWMLVLPLGFYPFDFRPEATSAIWTALPLVLIGFWIAIARTTRAAAVAAGSSVLALGLIAVPPLTGVARQGWEAWAACATALLIGWTVARYASVGSATAEPPRARKAASP